MGQKIGEESSNPAITEESTTRIVILGVMVSLALAMLSVYYIFTSHTSNDVIDIVSYCMQNLKAIPLLLLLYQHIQLHLENESVDNSVKYLES